MNKNQEESKTEEPTKKSAKESTKELIKEIKEGRRRPLIITGKGQITKKKEFSESLALFSLITEPRINYKAGSFILIRKPGNNKYHAFSICSAENENLYDKTEDKMDNRIDNRVGNGMNGGISNEIELLIRKVGEFTTWLFNQEINKPTEVEFLKKNDEEPESKPEPANNNQKTLITTIKSIKEIEEQENNNWRELVLIGGGVGIAPIISIIRTLKKWDSQGELKKENLRIKTRVFYSSRYEREIAFLEELEKTGRCSENLRIKTTITITREEPKEWKKTEECLIKTTGRLNADKIIGSIKEDNSEPEKTEIYLCGPPKMIESLKEELIRKGIKKEKIHFDEW